MWFPKIKKIQKLNLLKSGLNGGQKGILFFVHVNMNVSRIILILVANWQEIFGEWLINPRPKTESSEVTLICIVHTKNIHPSASLFQFLQIIYKDLKRPYHKLAKL